MSYDIYLNDPVTKKPIKTQIAIDLKGGTYPVKYKDGKFSYQGHNETHLNMTYNYAECFAKYDLQENQPKSDFEKLFGGGNKSFINRLDGRIAADTIKELEDMCNKLGDDISDNYWEATEGNAKRALYKVLAMAKMFPWGVWEIC